MQTINKQASKAKQRLIASLERAVQQGLLTEHVFTDYLRLLEKEEAK